MTAYERQLWYWQREVEEAEKRFKALEDTDPEKEVWRKKLGTARKCLKEVMDRERKYAALRHT